MLVKPQLMLISILSLLLALQPLGQLIQTNVDNNFHLNKDARQLRVMSWNVEHFKIAEHKSFPEKKTAMIHLINTYQPDVACFQEMVASDQWPKAINYLPEFAKKLHMPYYFYSYNEKLNYDRHHHFGIIIFSKYPLIKQRTISRKPNDYNSIFQWVDIQNGDDTFRIFNLHFQSLKFSNDNLTYFEDPLIDKETNFMQSKNVLRKFKMGFVNREVQSEAVKAEMNKSPYPVVVCGDFNDVPNSFAYHRIGEGMKNAFAEKGTGIGRTFSHINPTLRIDNIFADKGFLVSQYTRDKTKLSDHFPILADLEFIKPK
jgi:endonuclease/exonuclease/phosphatase family metal-dependent hydrolase